MSVLEIALIPLLSDNYGYLLQDPETGTVAVVDPAEAEPVIARIEAGPRRLDLILNTHHHGDHVGGNAALKARYGASIVGPEADRHRIPSLDRGVAEGDRVAVGAAEAEVFQTPGHTSGHIAFWFADSRAVFAGDTLMALGCGRLFEGSAAEMWASLLKLRRLPDETAVYCGHEYTQSNARFALTVERDNADLAERVRAIEAARQRGEPTIPSAMGLEKRTNPFLRADVAETQAAVGMAGADPVAVFAEIRGRKDRA